MKQQLLDRYGASCWQMTQAAAAIYDHAVETLAQQVFTQYCEGPIDRGDAIAEAADASEWVTCDYKAEAVYIGWQCQTGRDFTDLDLVESELSSAMHRAHSLLQESVAEALEDLISAA